MRSGLARGATSGPLALIASPEKADGSLTLRQDVSIYRGRLAKGESVTYPAQAERALWLQIISGEVQANGETLQPGDGLALEKISACEIVAAADAEFLLFDLA